MLDRGERRGVELGYSVMSNWYYLDEINQVNGPLSPHEMRNKVSDSVAYVWRDGLDEWTLSSDCPELERKVYVLKTRPQSSGKNTVGLDEDGQPQSSAFNHKNNVSKAINELLGIAKVVLMDGVVSDEEADFLKQWCENHSSLRKEWPISVLSNRMTEIFADGIVDDSERKDLKNLLEKITGGKPDVCDTEKLAIRLPIKSPEPEIVFEDKNFCITGKFILGPRKKVSSEIKSRGGFVESSVTYDLDYLVIGTEASRDWKHGNFGRKIEKAVKYQDKGGLFIVSEEHFVSSF